MDSKREIDDAIDRAVREIMSVEPRSDLRDRIMSSLGHRRETWFAVPRVAAVGGLVAAVILMFLWSRSAPEQVPPPAVAANDASAAGPISSQPSERGPQPKAAPPPATQAPPASVRPERFRFPAPGAVVAANVSDDLDTSVATAEAGVSASANIVSAQVIDIPLIQIQPLTIEPIVIAPIPPPR